MKVIRMRKVKRVIVLPREMDNALEEAADANNISVNDLLLYLIRRFLKGD